MQFLKFSNGRDDSNSYFFGDSTVASAMEYKALGSIMVDNQVKIVKDLVQVRKFSNHEGHSVLKVIVDCRC